MYVRILDYKQKSVTYFRSLVPHHAEHCEFVGGKSDPRNADPRSSWLISHRRATSIYENCRPSRALRPVSAESEDLSCAQGLSDGFGFGIDTLHYEVEIAASRAERRRGQGSFRDVRRLRGIEGDKS